MRNSLICPKCQGRKFYEVGECTVPAHDCINREEPLSVAAAYLPTGERGIFGAREYGRFVGQLHSFTCATCGYTEFYVGQLDALAYMAQQQVSTVRFIDASAGSEGAFR